MSVIKVVVMGKKREDRLENPAANASFYSARVSQSWMNGIFKKGSKQLLDDSDIHEVLERDSTHHLTTQLNRNWEHEVTSTSNPRLLIPIIKLAGFRYFSSIILITIQMAATITQSIYIGKIVASFQDIETEKAKGYVAATILVLCAFIEVILRHSVFVESLRTGMNARVALSSLVYNKALRMSQASMCKTDTGHIVNLVTNDVKKTEEAISYAVFLFPAPLLLFIACYLCWREIGFSFLPGMAVLLILPVFQSWLGRFFAALRAKTAVLRDQRIKLMNEVICGMRVIKMYAWEIPFAKLVSKIRRRECEKVLKTSRLNSLNASFYMATIPLVSTAVFIPYILSGNVLTSEKVFTVVAIISSVNIVTSKFVPRSITFLKESGVSLKRIKNFLLLDEGSTLSLNKVDGEQTIVVVENLNFKWHKDSEEEVLSNVSFTVSMGELLMVTGAVGSGKSSLLMALLRELPVTSGSIRISGRVAYVSQQPWVFSGTLKENILFGKRFVKTKYEEVIRVCALEKDIKSLQNEDETLVGERGVSLSGGQKARVNLARAIYLDANIYIMDDPLSAVDSLVARHIFNACIRGVLKSKVCILVSHQLQFLGQADRILYLQKGNVVGYGNLESLKQSGIDMLCMIHTHKEGDAERLFNHESIKSLQSMTSNSESSSHSLNLLSSKKRKKSTNTISLHDVCDKDPLLQSNETNFNTNRSKSAPELRNSSATDDIIFQPFEATSGIDVSDKTEKENIPNENGTKDRAEKRKIGSITFKVYKDYFLAGARPVFLLLCVIIFLTGQISLMISEWWLATWSNWEESTMDKNNAQSIEHHQNENIMIYVGTVVLCFLFAFLRALIWFQILVNASRHLHDKMFMAILRSPMYFFDTNPVGRILNRFSKDIGLMDDSLPMAFFDAFQLSVFGLAILVMSVVSQPYVVIVVVPIVAIFIWLRQYFVKSSREIKRLQALSRSPLYSHISATLQGLATIRASEQGNQFIEMYNTYQDHNTSASFYYLCASRWLGYRLDIICASLISFVAFAPFVAYEAGFTLNPVLVGLSLLYTKRLTGMFQFCVRQTAEVENQMVSVERVQEYTYLTPEAELEIPDKKPSNKWPQHGEIIGENLFFCYHPSLPPALKNITFHIKAKEKIGIVGRTGAGKSSFISALFRLAEPNGVIQIDGICINNIGLHDLRGKLSVIPQDPVIFAGSVRSNLDPFSNREDSDLWDALEQVQLKETVNNFPDKLEFNLAESGHNLSVGQRQLLCLARAMLTQNKILIVDEATANVDHKTDSLIQKTIRDKFKDCTVLTIAHRLNTIMDADRIMVFDSGKIIEFGEPYELLRRDSSTFSAMVLQTGKESSLQLERIARIAHDNRANNSIQC